MTPKTDNSSNERPSGAPRAGDWVRIAGVESLGGEGEVIKIDPRRRRARVRVSGQEWILPIERLTIAQRSAANAEKPGRIRVRGGGAPVVHEVDLHGQRVEEALEMVDRALDQAVVAHLHQVKIVHGHGTGTMRAAIRRFLANHPHVARYRFGGPAEGGLACTIAELRRPEP